MSRVVKQSIVCPECGGRSDIDMWESVNVTLDPEMSGAVRDGSVFNYECPKCGFKSLLVYPMLYHDMEKKLMIQLSTTEQGEEEFKKLWKDIKSGRTEETFKENSGIEPPGDMFKMPGYTVRIVPTYYKLKEKLFIFDAGLDDRIIELCKSILWNIVTKEGNSVERVCYMLPVTEDELGRHMRVQFFNTDGGTGTAEIDPDMYEDIKAHINVDANEGQLKIDEEWADKITGVKADA